MKIYFIVMFFAVSELFSQDIVPSVSNTLRYGNGDRNEGGSDRTASYFENLTDVRLSFQHSVALGFRLLDDDPPEVGDTFQGIQRRFIEVRQKDFLLRAGNFSEIFGRGLALNLFENRGFAYDTWMDGVKAAYRSHLFTATVLGGTIDFRDSVTVARHEKYKIRGGNAELHPLKEIIVGISYVDATGYIPQIVTFKDIHAEIPEWYASYSSSSINGFVEYANKWINVLEDSSTSIGNGLYASLSFSGKGYGIVIDYKDYRFDIRDPFERLDESRATKILPFQHPPTVQKEHTYTLLTRALHQVDFNDEVGIQAEAFYSISKQTMLNFNGSLSSRHQYYNYNTAAFTFSEQTRGLNFLPSLERRVSPYWEAFVEIEHYFQMNSAVRFGIARRTNILYNDFTGAAFSHIQRETIIPLQVQYALTDIYSVIIQSENYFADDNYNAGNSTIYTQLFSVAVTQSPDLSFSFRYEHTTDTTDPTGKQDWFITEAGYTFGQTHTATISYGRERGGQICSNGVCQYQLPFSGVRFTVRSQI